MAMLEAHRHGSLAAKVADRREGRVTLGPALVAEIRAGTQAPPCTSPLAGEPAPDLIRRPTRPSRMFPTWPNYGLRNRQQPISVGGREAHQGGNSPAQKTYQSPLCPHGCRIDAEQRNDAKCHEETSAARVAVAAAVSCSAASDTIVTESLPPFAHQRDSTTRGEFSVFGCFER